MIITTDNWQSAVRAEIERLQPDRTIFIVDSNVKALHYADGLENLIIIEAGEENKNLDSLAKIWHLLISLGATRRSLAVNLGGGMTTDIGGFAAATFKRGIRFINIPTTVLGVADAAVGGKTGIDFGGLKNEIGAFADAESVIISPQFFDTLSDEEILSGMAEVVKMAMIGNRELYQKLLQPGALLNKETILEGIEYSIHKKMEIVSIDPKESGLRRVLNFGHTAGHAYEEYALAHNKKLSHGYAVAHGISYALQKSIEILNSDPKIKSEYDQKILHEYYGELPIIPTESELHELMLHDKKSDQLGKIPLILLTDIGNFRL